MDLDVRQLRAFVAVAQEGSFTRAADALHLSQPALTVQIRKLEETLGLRLFDRNTRSVGLTRSGRDLLPRLSRVLRELDSVHAEARQLAASRSGIVRLAALPSFASGVLPEIIAAFRRSHPDIRFVIRDVIASAVTALTLAEEVDFGVTGGLVDSPDIEVLLRTSDHLLAVFPDTHPLAASGAIRLAELALHPLVLMEPATSVRQVVDAAFKAAGIEPRISAEATYMSTAVGMVRAGLGVAILPGSALEIAAIPSLRSAPVAEDAFARPIAVVKRAGRTLPPASARFLEALAPALVARFGERAP